MRLEYNLQLVGRWDRRRPRRQLLRETEPGPGPNSAWPFFCRFVLGWKATEGRQLEVNKVQFQFRGPALHQRPAGNDYWLVLSNQSVWTVSTDVGVRFH